jgi:hypothetical protein
MQSITAATSGDALLKHEQTIPWTSFNVRQPDGFFIRKQMVMGRKVL